MFFALKEAFPLCKLLPFTANAPLPPLQCWLLKEDILVNSYMKFSSAFNIAMGGGGGISTRNFFQNTKCIMSFVRDCRMLGKINGKLKFLYRKQNFLDGSLRRLLLNALIQPLFYYACTSWYPMLNKRLSKNIQAAQNKCIRFYLNLKNTAHIGATEFKAINWLPTKNRMDQCVCVNVMKFFN